MSVFTISRKLLVWLALKAIADSFVMAWNVLLHENGLLQEVLSIF